MKKYYVSALIFLHACSVSDREKIDRSDVSFVCSSTTYSSKQSEFFGDGAYYIVPQPETEKILDICAHSSNSEAEALKPICNWADRISISNSDEIGSLSFEAYWPRQPTELMTSKLNADACIEDN